MTRRLTLAGQLLALQLVIVVRRAGRRRLPSPSPSRTDAAAGHRGPARPGRGGDAGQRAAPPGGRSADRRRDRATCGSPPRSPAATPASASVVVAGRRPDGARDRRPGRARRRGSTSADSTVLDGRSWTGEPPSTADPAGGGDGADLRRRRRGPRRSSSVAAGVPVAARRARPRRIPNLLTYLGVASAVGVGGSLLVARRVKRQTLGLEPRGDRRSGRAPRRDAARHPRGRGRRSTCAAGSRSVNDEAIALLGPPATPSAGPLDDLGVGERPRATRSLAAEVERRPTWCRSATGCWCSTGMPIASRGRADRLGHDAARPHRAARAAARARRHPARHRHAARAGPRVQQPAAHHLRPDRARRVRRGRAATSTGSARAASEFSASGDRRGRRPGGRRAAHRQGQPGRRAGRRPAASPPDSRLPALDDALSHRRRHRGRQPGRQRAGRRVRGARALGGGGSAGRRRRGRLGPRLAGPASPPAWARGLPPRRLHQGTAGAVGGARHRAVPRAPGLHPPRRRR